MTRAARNAKACEVCVCVAVLAVALYRTRRSRTRETPGSRVRIVINTVNNKW